MSKLTFETALTELATQHAALRRMMERCEELADEVDAGGDPQPLTYEITRLRVAFSMHNEFEEYLLRPLLLRDDAFASTRIDGMVEEHVREHAEMRARLGSGPTNMLREVIASLRDHLDAEDRHLASTRPVHERLATG
jgi:hypothetical protein